MITTKDIAKGLGEVDWDFSGFVPNGKGPGIQGLHWYPAPFPPAVAGTLIDILGSDCRTFLDPFSGSGVAPLEAWFRGKRAFGIDNNRFAIKLGRAKSLLVKRGSAEIGTQLAHQYRGYRQRTARLWKNLSPELICEKSNMHPDCNRWFIPSVLAEIAIIKAWLAEGEKLPRRWSNVIEIILSSLLHGRLSIVRRYHYTYIVDNSRVKIEARDDVNVEDLFAEKLQTTFIKAHMIRDNLCRIGYGIRQIPSPRFIRGRAQELSGLIHQEIDLVVTSPPYFGMNDYTRSQHLSWLVFQWKGYNEDIKAESGTRRNRTSIRCLNSYFEDMRCVFADIYSVLRKGGYLGIILGSSETRLAKENDTIGELKKIIETIGFTSCWSGNRRVQFRKINNTPYRSEVIWVYQR
jgi:DNA modification methylase